MDAKELETKLLELESRAIQLDTLMKAQSASVGSESVYHDGPHEPRFFLWRGRVGILSSDQYRMALALWHAPGRRMKRIALAVEIYDDEERVPSLRNVARKFGKALARKDVCIPFSISREGDDYVLH